MLPFGVTFPATVPQGSEIPKGLMNNPVYDVEKYTGKIRRVIVRILCRPIEFIFPASRLFFSELVRIT
jgi:hypothetical protein